MEQVKEIQDFFGVYMLCSSNPNPRFRGKCYIGYTVNPNRRIKQHNAGKAKGGARQTSNRGPWAMVMIIHGFPNNISALRFEWAWQQPNRSRRLKGIPNIQKRKRNESNFDYNFRILVEMLRIGPWSRLPLTIRWLCNDFHKEFMPDKVPPMHMPICFGRVKIAKKSTIVDDAQTLASFSQLSKENCLICSKVIVNTKSERLTCIEPSCKLVCHIVCLSRLCLPKGQYVPIEIICPICENVFMWGDLIRKKNGCCDLESDTNNTDLLEILELSDEEDC